MGESIVGFGGGSYVVHFKKFFWVAHMCISDGRKVGIHYS